MDTTILDLPYVGEQSPNPLSHLPEYDPNGTLSPFLNRLRTEATTSRAPFLEPHEQCQLLYLYGSLNPNQPHRYNKTMGMVQTFVQLATQTPPVATLTPISVTDGGIPIMSALGEPRILDCATVTQYLQPILDLKLQLARAKQFYRTMAEKSAIFGWYDALYEFDDIEKIPDLRPIPPLQWYKDPTEEEVKDLHYVGVDWPIDAEEAKRLYPHLADAIDEKATRSVQTAPGATGYSSIYLSTVFARPIVTLSIWWLRNHEALMTDQEAMLTGVVEAREVPLDDRSDALSPSVSPDALPGPVGGAADGGTASGPNEEQGSAGYSDSGITGERQLSGPGNGEQDGVGTGVLGEQAGSGPAGAGGNADGPLSDAGSGEQGGGSDGVLGAVGQAPSNTNNGGQLDPSELPALPTREALIHKQTGQEITPQHPLWPRKRVIRQVIQIMNEIVDDKVCPHWDIPIISNFNVRIPGRPFGQGEPVRIAEIQKDKNAVHGSMVDHARWYRGPVNLLPKSIKDELPNGGKNFFMEPNKSYYVDDDLLRQYGDKLVVSIQPPELPQSVIAVNNGLDAAFDDAGGRPDALQGKPPTANSSGKLFEQTYAAGASTSSYRFTYLEEMWYRVARLTFHSILGMDPADLYAINKTFPPDVVPLILEYAKGMEWDVSVKIENEATRQSKRAEVFAHWQAGLIDAQTARQELGYDDKTVMQRMNLQATGAVPGASMNGSPQQLNGGSNPVQPAGHGSSPQNGQQQPAAESRK